MANTEGLARRTGIPVLSADRRASVSEIRRSAEALCEVMHMEDIKDVVDAFSDMNEALDAANEYGNLRANYAALEAASLSEIAKKGWASQIRGNGSRKKARVAKWLASLDDERYEEAIKCILDNGATAYSLYEVQVAMGDRMSAVYQSSVQKHSELDEYVDKGITKVSDKSSYGDCEIARAMNDSERIELRRLGAVGIGDGVYVNPKTHPLEVDKAIGKRRANISACVISLRELCGMAPDADFRTELSRALSDAGQSIADYDDATSRASSLDGSKSDVSSLLREANTNMLAARELANGTTIIIPERAIEALSRTVRLLGRQE